MLASMIKTSDEEEDYLEMNEEVKNAKEPRDWLKIGRFSQRSKRKNHKHSGKAQRVT